MTLNDIRKRSGLLIIVIGVAMLGFILTDLMSSGTSLFQKGQSLLLKLGNEEVTFTQFEKELEENINVKFLSSLGTVNITEEQRKTERDLLWEQTMEDILFSEQYEKSAIHVGSTEIWDLISGELTGNQSSLFSYFFREQTETGEWNQYDPELIREWLEIGSDNPQWFRYLFFKKNEIRKKNKTKYYNAIKKGLYSTKIDAQSYYHDQTKSIDGQYIYIPCTSDLKTIPSKKEISKYYDENKEDFKNTPRREISYFIFDLTPSDEDKISMRKELLNLVDDRKFFNKRLNSEETDLGFKNTNEIEGFINQYGDNKYVVTQMSQESFSIMENESNITIKENIILPYFDKGSCKMGRILDSNRDSISIVYLEREMYASDQTLNEIYSEVFDFINENGKITETKKVEERIKKRARIVTLEKMDQSVPGIGVNREIVKWAFNNETNLNETKFFDLQDRYIVAFTSNINETDFKSIAEVKEDIIKKLNHRKQAEEISSQLAKYNYPTLEEYAVEFNVKVKNIKQLRLNTDSFGEEGYYPEAVGTFFSIAENSISSPLITENGVFLFKKETDGTINYPKDYNSYKNLLKKTNQSQVDLLLVDILQEKVKMIDNRFNFY